MTELDPLDPFDTQRIAVGRTTFQEPPHEDYAPVLTVNIHGETTVTDTGIIFEPYQYADPLIDRHDELEKDEKRLAVLTEPLQRQERIDLLALNERDATTGQTEFPSFGMSSRMAMGFDDSVLDPVVEGLSTKIGGLGKRIARDLLATHELGRNGEERTGLGGGHFYAAHDPQTCTRDCANMWTELATFRRTEPPMIPRMYLEVRALLAEEELEAKLTDNHAGAETGTDFSTSISTVSTSFESQRRRRPLYELACNICDVLVEHFGQEGAARALDIARETDVPANNWLCHVLHDAQQAEVTDPDELRSDGSLWQFVDEDYEQLKMRIERNDDEILADPAVRAARTVLETVVVTNEGIQRRWFMRNPDPPAGGAINRALFVRRMVATMRSEHGRVINDGWHTTPFHVHQYQDAEHNPFAQALEGTLPPEEIHKGFMYKSDAEAFTDAHKRAGRLVARQSGFNGVRELAEWIVDE